MLDDGYWMLDVRFESLSVQMLDDGYWTIWNSPPPVSLRSSEAVLPLLQRGNLKPLRRFLFILYEKS